MADQDYDQSGKPITAAPVEYDANGKPIPSQPPAASNDWLGHLWNIAKTAGGDVVDAGKDVLSTAQEAQGDPFKFVGLMASKAGKAQLDELKKSYDLAQQHRYVEAYGHGVAGLTPVVGPVLAHVAENVAEGKGDEAVGHVLSTAAMTVAPEAAAEALPAIKSTMAARQAEQAPMRATRLTADLPMAIPPSKSTPYSPADVTRATPYLAAEHAESPIASVTHTIDAADSAISQIEDHIGQYVAANPNRTITTDPIAAAKAKLSQGARASDVTVGLKELDDLGLDKNVTIAKADDIRQRLNAENKATLKKNQYDTATALESDPAFAARYAAAQSLRDGIYDALEQQGIPGVRALRQDEGSLIAIRNAADRQRYNGQRQVAGTGATGPLAQLARKAIPATGAAIGGTAGPAGAAVGDLVGQSVAQAVAPGNLTRDALVAKAFQRLGLQQPPSYPSVPTNVAPRGLLTAPAIPLGEVPRTPQPEAIPPIIGGTSQPNVFTQRQIEAPKGRPMPSIPDVSGTGGLYPAKSILVRDPATGRFKRVFTSEVKK